MKEKEKVLVTIAIDRATRDALKVKCAQIRCTYDDYLRRLIR